MANVQSFTCPTDLPSWKALVAHAEQLKTCHIQDLFTADDARFAKFSVELPSLLLDYSKNLITDETKAALLALAVESDIVGSSRVDLQACKLEYSIVSPK